MAYVSDGMERYDKAVERALRDKITDPAECTPAEVDFAVGWDLETAQVLRGSLTAMNVSPRPWRITGKPTIILVASDGRELKSRHIVTAEGRIQPWLVIQPGAGATASVSVSY